MTIVAYRDGILAADRLVSTTSLRFGETAKVFRLRRPSGPNPDIFVGMSGTLADYGKLRPWIEGEDRAIEFDEGTEFLLIDSRAVYYARGKHPYPAPIVAPYYAIGSGEEVAMGAMRVGATAEEAVQAAIALCPGCGGEMEVIRVFEEGGLFRSNDPILPSHASQSHTGRAQSAAAHFGGPR